MEQESIEMNEQISSDAYAMITVDEFTDLRLLIVTSMISTIDDLNLTNPNSYLNKLVKMLKKYYTFLKEEDDICVYIFAEIYSLQSTQIPPFKHITFMTTAERLYTMNVLCQYFDQLIKHAQQAHDINNYLFLSDLFESQFCKKLCDLKERFVKEANELREIINRPDMDKYTLSVIRIGLISNIESNIEFNQVGNEFDKLNKEILNKIGILDREESTATAYHDVEMYIDVQNSDNHELNSSHESSRKRFKRF